MLASMSESSARVGQMQARLLGDVGMATSLLHLELVNICAYSPDGSHIATGSADGSLRVWDTRTGAEILQLHPGPGLTACAYSPDGALLAAGAYDGMLHLFDAHNGQLRNSARVSGDDELGVASLAFAPDGHMLLVGCVKDVLVKWNVDEFAESARFFGHEGTVVACAVAPNGKVAASVAKDDILVLWDTKHSSSRKQALQLAKPIRTCAISPDEEDLVLTYYDTVFFCDLLTSSNRPLHWAECSDRIRACAFSRSGRTLACANGPAVSLFDAHRYRLGRYLDDPTCFRPPFVVEALCGCTFSRDGEYIFAAGGHHGDGTPAVVKAWTASIGSLLWVKVYRDCGAFTSCACSPDGRYLACGSSDHTIRVFDAKRGEMRATLRGHADEVSSCGFSPDGQQIVSASRDHTMRVWDVTTESTQIMFRGHNAPVTACGYSADGRWLFSGGEDCLVHLWDVASGRRVQTYRTNWPVTAVAGSADSACVAVGDLRGFAYVLSVEQYRPGESCVDRMVWPTSQKSTRILYLGPKNMSERERARYVAILEGLRREFRVDMANYGDPRAVMPGDLAQKGKYEGLVVYIPHESGEECVGTDAQMLRAIHGGMRIPVLVCASKQQIAKGWARTSLHAAVEWSIQSEADVVDEVTCELHSVLEWWRRQHVIRPRLRKQDGMTVFETRTGLYGGLTLRGSFAVFNECKDYRGNVSIQNLDREGHRAAVSCKDLFSLVLELGRTVRISLEGVDREAERLARRLYDVVTSDYPEQLSSG